MGEVFMKTEVEARLLDVDEIEFQEKLKELNAVFVGDWIQVRNCYDFNPLRENSWIRLRKEGAKTTLTIKEIGSDKIDGTKESEIEVSDFDMTNEILNKLGYFARSIQENRRRRYILDEVEIDIDSWPKIPTYVEFEAKNESDIKNVCIKLGIDFENLVTFGVTEIYKHYGLDLKTLPARIYLEENRKSDVDKNFKIIAN